jgi:hypothetical protein
MGRRCCLCHPRSTAQVSAQCSHADAPQSSIQSPCTHVATVRYINRCNCLSRQHAPRQPGIVLNNVDIHTVGISWISSPHALLPADTWQSLLARMNTGCAASAAYVRYVVVFCAEECSAAMCHWLASVASSQYQLHNIDRSEQPPAMLVPVLSNQHD